MRLFPNPSRIETVSAASWDWEVQNALLHARGAGIDLPDPEVRFWTFQRSGLGVAARVSRDMLLVGEIHYDVWVFPLSGSAVQLTENELLRRGLPEDLAPAENLTPEEVEEFLIRVELSRVGGPHS